MAEALKPSDGELAPKEICAMGSSGAGVHGSKKDKHVHQYKVQPIRALLKG